MGRFKEFTYIGNRGIHRDPTAHIAVLRVDHAMKKEQKRAQKAATIEPAPQPNPIFVIEQQLAALKQQRLVEKAISKQEYTQRRQALKQELYSLKSANNTPTEQTNNIPQHPRAMKEDQKQMYLPQNSDMYETATPEIDPSSHEVVIFEKGE